MKSKISPTAIGVFIAGAIVIIFGSVLLFGSGKLFKHTKTYLLTFREGVTGLDVGAPVKLMGVSIGSVKSVDVTVGGVDSNLLINVFIDVDKEKASDAITGYALHLEDRAQFDRAVDEKGLRGQLGILSLLSAQLYIELDLHPDKPGFRLNEELKHGYWEIPTLPSEKKEMMSSLLTTLNNLSQTDLSGAVEELKGLIVDVRSDLNALELKQVGTKLGETLSSLDGILEDPQLKSAITNLNSALAQLDQLGATLNPRINPLLDEISADLKKTHALLDGAIDAVRQLKIQVEPNSTLSRELINTLDQAGNALNSLRHLVEQIEQNPSSLITGKKVTTPQQQTKP